MLFSYFFLFFQSPLFFVSVNIVFCICHKWIEATPVQGATPCRYLFLSVNLRPRRFASGSAAGACGSAGWRPAAHGCQGRRALFLWEVSLSCAPKSLPSLHPEPGTRGPFSSHLLSGGSGSPAALSPAAWKDAKTPQRPTRAPRGWREPALRTAAPPAFGDYQAVASPQGLRATP